MEFDQWSACGRTDPGDPIQPDEPSGATNN
jgi:hypothetical protein